MLGTDPLQYGCGPRRQDFQEIEPVPSALVNNSTREHFGMSVYPEAAPGLFQLSSPGSPDIVILVAPS